MATCVLLPECCRCCLVEENDMVYVFDILDEFDSKICDLIEVSGGIRISEQDCFSKNICGNCLNDLANAARFRNRCAKTEQILHNTSVVVDEQLKTDHKDQESFVCEESDEDLTDVSIVKLEADDLVEFSDGHRSVTPEIQYVIAEDPGDPELEVFDYESLISSQNSQADDVQSVQRVATASSSRLELSDPGSDDGLVSRSRETILNFVCQDCGAGFALQKNLAKHMLSHQCFVCDTCLRVFENQEDLDSHQALGHLELVQVRESEHDTEPKIAQIVGNPRKNHPCEFCGKAFVSNSALTSHIRVHTKERPYACSFCGSRFRTVGAQELHERRHSGIKPYKCDLCGRGFAESSNLKVHRRTHTNEKPHVCTVCNRAFARVFLLKVHQRTHSGERPFGCEECGRQFAQQGDLAAHRRTHTGERPHRCDICGQGFIKSSGLAQHRKKHEAERRRRVVRSGEVDGEFSGYQPEEDPETTSEVMFEVF